MRHSCFPAPKAPSFPMEYFFHGTTCRNKYHVLLRPHIDTVITTLLKMRKQRFFSFNFLENVEMHFTLIYVDQVSKMLPTLNSSRLCQEKVSQTFFCLFSAHGKMSSLPYAGKKQNNLPSSVQARPVKGYANENFSIPP